MTIEELAQRVQTLEADVATLKECKSNPLELPWPQRMFGSMAAFPEFQEVTRLGKEWRDAQREDYDKAAESGAA